MLSQVDCIKILNFKAESGHHATMVEKLTSRVYHLYLYKCYFGKLFDLSTQLFKKHFSI